MIQHISHAVLAADASMLLKVDAVRYKYIRLLLLESLGFYILSWCHTLWHSDYCTTRQRSSTFQTHLVCPTVFNSHTHI